MDSFNTETVDNQVESTSQSQVSQDPQGNVANTPQEVEIKADGLYRIPGQAKAVKWEDYHKGLQGSLTKATQEAAKLRAENAQALKKQQEYEQRIQEFDRQKRLSEINSQQGKRSELINTLRSLPYLKGDEAAYVVENLQSEIGAYRQALEQRDQVSLVMAKLIQELKGKVETLMQSHSGNTFETKISNFLKDLELGDDQVAKDLAKEIYLAYEGDDLDQEFPNIFRSRWSSLEENFQKREKAKRDAARKAPFVPGRGGVGVPSRPLQAKGNESAREIAERMWPGVAEKT